MHTGVLHQIPLLHTQIFVTCGRKRNFKKSSMGLQLRKKPAVTKILRIVTRGVRGKGTASHYTVIDSS